MRIDLHCHTKKTKKGDSTKRNVSCECFRQALIDANVGIVAITNHNQFDYAQYCEFKEATRDISQVWPGIELDVKGKIKNGHVIVIANPKNAECFNTEIKALIDSKQPDEVLLPLDTFIHFIEQKDYIVIVHYFKPKSLDHESGSQDLR